MILASAANVIILVSKPEAKCNQKLLSADNVINLITKNEAKCNQKFII